MRATRATRRAPSMRNERVASATKSDVAVAREIVALGRGQHLGVVEQAVGLERAVHHRHRDRGVAAAEQAVVHSPQHADHALPPERLEPHQFGSAPGIL